MVPVLSLFLHFAIAIPAPTLELTVDSSKPGAEIDLTCYALGQGGLSDQPMFDTRLPQLAQPHRICGREQHRLLQLGYSLRLSAAKKIRPAQGRTRAIITWIELNCLLAESNYLVIASSDLQEWEAARIRTLKRSTELTLEVGGRSKPRRARTDNATPGPA